MKTVLLVEDHQNLAASLKAELESDGYRVEHAATCEQASEKMNSKPDLIILDWALPDGNGLDFLRELRLRGSHVPVIFLTARAELVDKILGLEMGANDFMTKPFEARELLARVRVQLRQLSPARETADLRVGPLTIDRSKHKVLFAGVDVELVKKEYDLLVLFAENPERVFSRDEILNRVWGYDVYPTTRTVDTHVMLLRQKMSDTLIETVRSVGYRLRALPATASI